MGTGSMAYQPRYPLAQAPGFEFQGMNYKDWMNRCTDGAVGELFADSDGLREGIVTSTAILSLVLSVSFPAYSAAIGIISVLLPIWWPAQAGSPGTTEAQVRWEQWMTAAEEMVDQKVNELVKNRAIDTTRILQSRMKDYQQAICNLKTDPDNEKYKEDVRREFNDAEDQAKDAVIQFGNSNYALPLLVDYAQAANLHLLLLRDVVKFGESWGFSALEVQQYYFNNEVGNPGMKQLLATYTDHCVRYYNEGLTKRSETGNWNTFNDYRRNMTIMVMDIVSIWPTYDPRVYTLPTKSQLTREVYTPINSEYATVFSYSFWEPLLPSPSLFRWLRELIFFRRSEEQDPGLHWQGQYSGYQQMFRHTLNEVNAYYTPVVGDTSGNIRSTLRIGGGSDAEVYKIKAGVLSDYPNTFDFYFTPSGKITSVGDDLSFGEFQLAFWNEGLACKTNPNESCGPCTTDCTIGPVNTTVPCDNLNLASHRLSWMVSPPDDRYTDIVRLKNNFFGWTHFSVDANNLIDAEKITQIPAVKGYNLLRDARVIKGPGSTGGDLVELAAIGGFMMKVTTPASEAIGYTIRIRYASKTEATLFMYIVPPNSDVPRDQTFMLPATTSDDNLTYTAFNYENTSWIEALPATQEEFLVGLQNLGEETIIIDKLEFIPIEGSVEEYEANQALEKARKAVNALFTNDAKNALQLNVTDYAVDQAANLAECVSD
ncbi:insecticidal delta-endotoxin Cry8Ea1 family protein, partial [Bacillus mycoides]|uniref:insecticidal delta-endotoxin Cry8Ea1 family protein n=1 Tax=Bacillus mycoides TaxID=1405 RepID=UPI003D64B5C6